jgi:hypothetical protein
MLAPVNKEVRLEESRKQNSTAPLGGKSHMPSNSLFFEKVVPALLILMGIVMVALVLFAAGVLLGIVHF